jgi:hypothetical protein
MREDVAHFLPFAICRIGENRLEAGEDRVTRKGALVRAVGAYGDTACCSFGLLMGKSDGFNMPPIANMP